MNLIYGIKDRPKFPQLVLFAIQQLLAIMAATIAVPSVVNSVTGSELTASAAIFGAGIGKMVSPQCVAIGAGAIGLVGSESRILRAVFRPFLLYLALASLLSAAFLYATA